MKFVSVIVALIVVVSAKSTIKSTKSAIQTTHKIESTAKAHSASKTEVEWINGPQFRSTGGSRATLATLEMVDAASEAGAGDIIQTQQAERAMFMLKSAITQIKGDIMRKSSDLRSEAEWVAAVKQVMIQFETKVNKTKAAIADKKTKLKKLLKKKRQLENLLLQLKLEMKLTEARKDMSHLQTALRGVALKKDNFNTNKKQVQQTVDQIKNELKALNGGTLPETATQIDQAQSLEAGGASGEAAKKLFY